MTRGDYQRTNLRFPVMGTDGVFHDVFGYLECYWDCHFFFFHMPDGGAVIYKIGDTCYAGVIPMFNTWEEVAEHWLSDQEKYWGEKRYNDNFCPSIALEKSLAGWRIAYDNAYEYTAFNDEGNVIRVNFREGKVLDYQIPGKGAVRYYFPGILNAFITEDGYLRSGNKDLHDIGRLNLEATLNCNGKYFITEDGTTYSEACLWSYANGSYGLISEYWKCKNAFCGREYRAFHHMDNTVTINTTRVKKYEPLEEKDIKKVLFTESHIVFLHNDGHVFYRGQNKYRCCTGLEKYTNVKDIWGTDYSTTLLLESGEEIHIPKR